MKKTWTKKKQKEFEECKFSYLIKYTSPHGHGKIIVKTAYYNEFIKKFSKALEDVHIISMVEITDMQGGSE